MLPAAPPDVAPVPYSSNQRGGDVLGERRAYNDGNNQHIDVCAGSLAVHLHLLVGGVAEPPVVAAVPISAHGSLPIPLPQVPLGYLLVLSMPAAAWSVDLDGAHDDGQRMADHVSELGVACLAFAYRMQHAVPHQEGERNRAFSMQHHGVPAGPCVSPHGGHKPWSHGRGCRWAHDSCHRQPCCLL